MSDTQQIEKLFDAKLAHILDLNEAQSKDIADIKECLQTMTHDCRARHEVVDHEIAELKAVQAFKNGKSQGAQDFSQGAYLRIGILIAAISAAATVLQWWVLKG